VELKDVGQVSPMPVISSQADCQSSPYFMTGNSSFDRRSTLIDVGETKP